MLFIWFLCLIISASAFDPNPDEAQAKNAAGAEWANDEPGFYVAGNTGFYPPTASYGAISDFGDAQVGFGFRDILSTGLSIFAGIFMVVFSFTLLRNILDSDFVSDIVKKKSGKSIDVEQVGQVARMIFDAYQEFQD